MRIATAVAFALLVLLPVGCDQSPPDSVPPTISWAYPHDGDTVDPGVYIIAAVATDDRGVDFVVFFVGNEMLGMVRNPQADTYKVAVDCSADTSSVYLLRAFVYDKADNGTSADITVHVRR
jgi:hypothetical protein